MLSYIPKGVPCTEELIEELYNGCTKNQDSFGYAILHNNGKELVIFRSMSAMACLEQFEKDRAIHGGPALFHSRWATHGEETVRNAHPFRCGKDEQTVMAHNGVLPMSTWPAKGERRSDTNIFAKRHLASWGMRLDSPKFVEHVSKFIGSNKLVFITASPKYAKNVYLYNMEELGTWSQVTGALHSNSDFRFAHYSSPCQTSFTDGWWNDDFPSHSPRHGAAGIIVGTPNSDWLPGRQVHRAASVDAWDGSTNWSRDENGEWQPFRMNTKGQRVLTEADVVAAHGYVPVSTDEGVWEDRLGDALDALIPCNVCGSFKYDSTWKACEECMSCGECYSSLIDGSCQCYCPEWLVQKYQHNH